MRNELVLLAALSLVTACGDAPRDAQSAESAATDPHAGAQLPPNHPGMQKPPPLTDPSQFAGRALLKGELAHADKGMLMVMLRPKGTRMPIWAYRIDLHDPDAAKQGLAAEQDGVRELTFVLNKDTTLIPSPIPPGFELEVSVTYDPDGDIDTKDGQITGFAAAKRGDDALVIELDPAKQP